MFIERKQIELYMTEDGEIPFEDWFDGLRDAKTRARIKARIARLRTGSWGQYKPVGEGVTEFILDFGPGYRIYAGQIGSVILLLLCGGDKSTRLRDIATAKAHWSSYHARLQKEVLVHVEAS